MASSFSATIKDHFSGLTDPRVQGRIKHNLIDIITITICAVVSGANDFVHIQKYGESKKEWLETFLALPNGIPSHDTIGRFFRCYQTII